jgi:hypothetical protein
MQRLGWVSGPRDPGNGTSFYGAANSTPRNNKVYKKTRQYEEYKFRVMIPYSLVDRCTGAKVSNETATPFFTAAE